jgi:hypothetical protein
MCHVLHHLPLRLLLRQAILDPSVQGSCRNSSGGVDRHAGQFGTLEHEVEQRAADAQQSRRFDRTQE